MARYEHLLSPLKIGNITLKNRMLNSKCVSSDEMEPELSGPFYEHLARNGAALVCVGVGKGRALPPFYADWFLQQPCGLALILFAFRYRRSSTLLINVRISFMAFSASG